VFENLPQDLPRVISVGRLDLNSEGLLLLTNDGELARKLELPTTGWVRRYRVRVNGRVDPASLARLAAGVEVEGLRYGPIEAILDRQQGGNAWLTMSLTEGKNREIRNVCAFFGWTVSRLIRLSYGPFQLGHLERGEIEEVPGKVLRDQIGQPGAPQPLRPQQGSGGKARPPKPRSEPATMPGRPVTTSKPAAVMIRVDASQSARIDAAWTPAPTARPARMHPIAISVPVNIANPRQRDPTSPGQPGGMRTNVAMSRAARPDLIGTVRKQIEPNAAARTGNRHVSLVMRRAALLAVRMRADRAKSGRATLPRMRHVRTSIRPRAPNHRGQSGRSTTPHRLIADVPSALRMHRNVAPARQRLNRRGKSQAS